MVLLEGVVGSRAHGLATESSDADQLGVFAYPTSKVVGLRQLEQSVVEHAPDRQLHEVGKFVHLALKCNPSTLELLWLPEYQSKSWHGAQLVELRTAFLSRDMVRNSYIGYARQQWAQMEGRHVPITSLADDARAAKHARHLFRMLESGMGLYRTGELMVRVADRAWYLNVLPTLSTEQVTQLAEEREDQFLDATSSLPESPDSDAVERFLIQVRKDLW